MGLHTVERDMAIIMSSESGQKMLMPILGQGTLTDRPLSDLKNQCYFHSSNITQFETNMLQYSSLKVNILITSNCTECRHYSTSDILGRRTVDIADSVNVTRRLWVFSTWRSWYFVDICGSLHKTLLRRIWPPVNCSDQRLVHLLVYWILNKDKVKVKFSLCFQLSTTLWRRMGWVAV
jgi:hypothetical protein